MAFPSVRSVGAVAAAAAVSSIQPALPAGYQADDILLLVCEHTPTTDVPTVDQGYTLLATQNQGTNTRLDVYWKRAAASETAPIVTSGAPNHYVGVLIAIQGCSTTGLPFDFDLTGSTATNVTHSIPAGRTSGPDRLVIGCISRANDAAGAGFSGWTNADLASLTEVIDDGTLTGNGGGIAIVSGQKATAGAFGATTVTTVSTQTAALVVSFMPPSTSMVDTVSDSFTRADSADLGTDWVPISNDLRVVSGRANNSTTTNQATEQYAHPLASDDYYVRCKAYVDNTSGTNIRRVGLYARMPQGDLANLYALTVYRPASGGTAMKMALQKGVNGAFSSIGSPTEYTIPAWTTGSTIELRVVGNSIKGFLAGVEVISATDSSLPSGRFVALNIWAALNTQNAEVDDFEAAVIYDDGPFYVGDISSTLRGGATLRGEESAGTETHEGSATLSGGGTLVASGSTTRTSAPTLSGGGTITVSTVKAASATAIVSGGGTLTASVSKTTSGSGVVSGGGAVTSAGHKQANATATISGGGTLSASGFAEGAETHSGEAVLSGGGTLSASSHKAAQGSGIVTGAGAFTAAVLKTGVAQAALAGGGTLSGVVSTTHAGTAVLGGGGSLVPAVSTTRSGLGVISGGGSIVATGRQAGEATTLRYRLSGTEPNNDLAAAEPAIALAGREPATALSGRTYGT